MPEIINSYQYAGLPAAKSNKKPNFVNLSQQHQQNRIARKYILFAMFAKLLVTIGDDFV